MKTLATAAAVLALAAPALAQLPGHRVEGPEGTIQEVMLQVHESEAYGPYLVTARSRGEEGRPVYMFETDRPATEDQQAIITCTSDQCLRLWTPVSGGVILGEGLERDLLGTMAYGDLQVALYNGWPLYHYSRDQVPMSEEPQGHDVESYGGEWYLMSPSGEPITD